MEQSHLPVRRTLAKIGVPPTTFYRWCDHFVEHVPEGLTDKPSSPSRVWNRIPDAVRGQIVSLVLSDNHHGRRIAENGSAKVCHGSGGIVLLRAE